VGRKRPDALDVARDARDASRALSRYRGSPQNFVLADRNGEVAYHVAGVIPDDPAWGRYVHPQTDVLRTYPALPYDSLPSAVPTRTGVLVSANNQSYDAGYRYRLSAQFEPPYRAFRIAQLLAARPRYDVAYFAGMQLDTYSPIDAEISREVLRVSQAAPIGTSERMAFEVLRGWDGRFDPDSHGAALEHAVRLWLLGAGIPLGPRLEQLRAGGAEEDCRSVNFSGRVEKYHEQSERREDLGDCEPAMDSARFHDPPLGTSPMMSA